MAPKTLSQKRPKTHTIIVAQRSNFVVRPGKLDVSPGDRVRWKVIGTSVHIFFPSDELFGRSTLRVDAEKRSETLPVRDDAPEKIYPYSVYCDRANAFAQGGSVIALTRTRSRSAADPELIVEF
jgi:hypothetical protein